MTEIQRIEKFLIESNKIERIYDEDEPFNWAMIAWSYAETVLHDRTALTVANVLQIHEYLMRPFKVDHAGQVRRCAVMIGGFVKPYYPVIVIEDQIRFWSDKWYHRTDMTDLELQESHVHFEDIHPFEDGNGRTGRILWNIMRLRNGHEIQIIHEGEEQQKYYKWFQTQNTKGRFFDHP